MVETSDIVGIIGIFVASPILLAILFITGGLALFSMFEVLASPLVIALVMLINTVFYAVNKMNYTTALITGVLSGFIYWAIGVISFLGSPVGAFCQIPVIGNLACGAGVLADIFIHLTGFILGAIILSAIIGTFLIAARPSKKRR